MRTIKIENFLNSELCDYASYDNLRKIASVVDGFKNASRKVAYTIQEKKIKENVKVSQLASKIAEFSDYLHGDASLPGVIVSLARRFVGTNNIPLMKAEGNFGSRFTQDPAAPRYIFSSGEDIFFKLFNPDDREILRNQTFEGEKIEPMFYVPSLPLLLINGSEGLSTGFAQKILPRDPEKIKKLLLKKLSGKKLTVDDYSDALVPFYKGYKGLIRKGDHPNQWIIEGVIEKKDSTHLLITEIPIGYELKQYCKILDKLEDDKFILSYKDLSDKDNYKFEIRMMKKDIEKFSIPVLLDKFKLVKTITENYTCINENNRIVIFDTAKDIFDYYYDVKIQYIQKRKDFLVKSITDDIRLLASKYTFVKGIVDGNIVVQKRKKVDIVKDLEKIEKIIKFEGNYDYLLRMPVYSLTDEKLTELLNLIKERKAELDKTISLKLEEMWVNDVKAL